MFDGLLQEKAVLVADGAMGTTLFELGLESGDSPERLNVEQPDMIAQVHRNFVKAGADLILTNTFGGNRRRMSLHRMEDRVGEFNRAGVSIAKRVAEEAERPVVVAASVGPTGDLFAPLGLLSHAEGVEVFSEQMESLVAAGADILWIETLSAWEEIAAATEAASGLATPHAVTLSFDTNGRTMMGLRPSDFGKWWTELPPDRRPVALGANCGTGLQEALTAAAAIKEAAAEATVIVKSNCGIPVFREGGLNYPEGPEQMGDYARQALEAGCSIIGACCGSTPPHIQAIRAALDGA
ncbi:MAG: betaine--homocysteine S-methyltransferase [Actinomycetia bacterium]|nr:betaine--homocysteine S-methyltransferase [Actinomycetes bacterium]